MNVLIIAAHPDDEVLGCGGTIARMTRAGEKVSIAILGEGITSRYQQRSEADQEIVAALHQKSELAANLMGVHDYFHFDLPDNRFDHVDLLDVTKIIEGLIEKTKPSLVFTQHGGDLNLDHNITFRATMTATRPMKGTTVKTLLAYEVASSTEWAFQQFSPLFVPNIFYDISATLQVKIDAMAAYESEARAFPHPRSGEALTAIARRWGSVVGMDAAEAFAAIRELR